MNSGPSSKRICAGGLRVTNNAARAPPARLAVAHAINTRPRKTLAWKTPMEALYELLAGVQIPPVATTG
jgi:hypothetical protein